MNDVMYKSNTCEWETPNDFFEKLNSMFHFNLDPCSTNENAKCKKFFTKKDDGLKQTWGAIVYFAIRLTESKLVNG